MSSTFDPPARVAVIGAGMAGAACAASLREAGLAVTLFDKSRGVGGRLATRRAEWVGADGFDQRAEFDHGVQHIQARHPRFRAALRKAAAAGVVAPWAPRVHAAWPASTRRESWVPLPQSPTLARHLIGDTPIALEFQVQRLQRGGDGWRVVAVDGSTQGPFDQVLLAMPPAQAAVLLAGHHDRWADALAAVRMEPCWTLMAVTQDVDWPWDACEPDTRRSPLAWVARNDRKPGRAAPAGMATWVAHASPAWSAAHLESQPAAVQAALSQALAAQLPTGLKLQWHHRAVHRWRYAVPAISPATAAPAGECWWDARRGLGVCGDFLGAAATAAGGVEAAWRSGDELADTVLAALDEETAAARPLDEQPAARVDDVALAHAA
jgi:predicted NAD/FAD-dependent oxidoreductase